MEIKQTNHCSNQRLKIKSNLVRMRLLLHFSLRVIGGNDDVMSCKYCSWFSQPEMVAEMALVLCQFKGTNASASSRTQKWGGPGRYVKALWGCGVLPPSRSAWPANPWSLAAWPSFPAHSVVGNAGQVLQAKGPSLDIPLAVEIVKILSDILGKLCKT